MRYRINNAIFLKQRVVVLLISYIIAFLFCQNSAFGQNNDTNNLWTVVIDPGHGGKDPGTLGRKCREADIVLGIGLKLGKYIEQNLSDVKVIYTRKTNRFIELHKRADIANKNKADLFISIHADWYRNSRITGPSTYAMGIHLNEENLALAQKENAVITLEEDYTTKYEGYDPNSPESYIIFSLMQNTYLDQSLEFASFVQDQFRERAKRHDRGVRQAGFLVLAQTTMPSVLIETGFVSNPSEEKYLISQQGQEHIASAIYRAFKEYKKNIEDKSNFIIAQEQNTIRFMVQISSSHKQISLDSDFFKGHKNIYEFKINKTYKYALLDSGTYDETIGFSKTLQKDFPGAFLIAVRNNTIIPIREALNIINK